MRKQILTCLTALLLLAAMVFSVHAAAPLVVDNGELLTQDEESKLTEVLSQVADAHSIDIVVLTVDSLDGKTAMAYADDYYDYNGYAENGVLLLVSMTEREWWISTCGSCIWDIDSGSIDYIADMFLGDLSNGNYYDAFASYAYYCDEVLSAPADDGYDHPVADDDHYDYVYYEEGPSLFKGILVCLVIGAAVGGIVVLVMASQLKSVRSQPNAASYVRPGSMRLTVSRDTYLYQNTTRRPRPKDNGGSGGGHGSSGSVHRSSSGRSHGGGGGRF